VTLPSSRQPIASQNPAPSQTQGSPPKYNLYGLDRVLWKGKVGTAFLTIASLISLTINVILIVAVLLLGQQLFKLKSILQGQLVDGLYTNFVQMDDAHIRTEILVRDTIKVEDTIPVVFDLPLKQNTTVILTQDTPVQKATVFLNGQPVPTDIVLRKGTPLNILLDLVVPVNQTIPVTLNVPVSLTVPVDIPLDQTELHGPFVGLQEVVSPYKTLLEGLPNSWMDTPFCGPLTGWLCKIVLGSE
jgi:hypothetical protein